MQAIILAGGLGTRLCELYPDRPKVMVPVADKPFIEWQLEWLQSKGITDIHLALGHKADTVTSWLSSYRHDTMNITTSIEPAPLGTGGALKFVEPSIRTDPCLVLNGDSLLWHLDLAGLAETHRRHSPMVAVAVTRVDAALRFGTVTFDHTGEITAFQEKAHDREQWVNGGVYLMSHQAIADIEAQKKISFESDIIPSLVQHGQAFAHTAPPPLLDMGTPDGLETTTAFLRDMEGTHPE